MTQNNPMVTVYALCASAVLFAVLAVLCWTGVLDLGIPRGQLALLFGFAVVMDVVVATMLWLRAVGRR